MLFQIFWGSWQLRWHLVLYNFTDYAPSTSRHQSSSISGHCHPYVSVTIEVFWESISKNFYFKGCLEIGDPLLDH